MMMIVSHHLISYSNLPILDGPLYVFNEFFNSFGKVGAIGFMLITGYFMVDRKFNYRKLISLVAEVWFYSYSINIILMATGLLDLSWHTILNTMFPIILFEWWFITEYLIIALMSPIINNILTQLSKNQYAGLITVLMFISFILPTMIHRTMFSEFLILLTAYCTAGYIKLHPNRICEDLHTNIFITVLFLLIHTVLILFEYQVDYVWTWGLMTEYDDPWYLLFLLVFPLLTLITLIKSSNAKTLGGVLMSGIIAGNIIHILYNGHLGMTDMNVSWNAFSFLTALSLFLVFKNIRPHYSKTINVIGGATLAVYIIHFQMFLRSHIFEIADLTYHINYPYYCIYVPFCVGSIFFICVFIELIRKKIFDKVGSHFPDLPDRIVKMTSNLLNKWVDILGTH